MDRLLEHHSLTASTSSCHALTRPHGDILSRDIRLVSHQGCFSPDACRCNADWQRFRAGGQVGAQVRRVVITEGHLLAGQVRYRQPAVGFRSGLEPVLLAASVAAKPGERVLEAGTGAGAALLCLAARVGGVHAVGVELDEALAELATTNAAENGFARIEIQAGRFESIALSGCFDHALANPPYHVADGSASPIPGRKAAKQGSAALIETWTERMASALSRHGSLSLSVPAAIVPMCLAAMARHRCPCTAIFPFWPKSGRAAKLVLLRGVRLSRSPMRLLPGLVLHQPDGSFTEAAKAILAGAPLNLDP